MLGKGGGGKECREGGGHAPLPLKVWKVPLEALPRKKSCPLLFFASEITEVQIHHWDSVSADLKYTRHWDTARHRLIVKARHPPW